MGFTGRLALPSSILPDLSVNYQFFAINCLTNAISDTSTRNARGGFESDNNANKAVVGRLDADPTGLSKHVGSEVDLIAGYQGIPHLQTKFVLGYFFPGRAFPDTARDGVVLASVLFRYNLY